MYNRNEAYDFKALEERELKRGKIVKLPGSRLRRKEKLKAQKILFISTFSIFLVTALCVSGFVLGQAKLTEFTDKAAKASVELEQCQSLNTQLRMKLETIQSSDSNCSFKNKNDCAVEIIKVHNGDTAKIS